jgi:hypothetical protein
MNHLTEEELIARFYRESSPYGESSLGNLDAHLPSCHECSARYAELKHDLESVRLAPIPLRTADYGDQVWQALRPSLTPYEPQQKAWRNWITWKFAVSAAAFALLAVAAFIGGRIWERHNNKVTQIAANTQTKQRVVLVVLTDHLDRTERLLVALQHTDAADTEENSQLQSEARELLASNRLYRASAGDAGDPALAAALDRLERVLAEVANNPTLTSADLNRVRNEMNTGGILFEIRVLLSRSPDQTSQPSHANGASI